MPTWIMRKWGYNVKMDVRLCGWYATTSGWVFYLMVDFTLSAAKGFTATELIISESTNSQICYCYRLKVLFRGIPWIYSTSEILSGLYTLYDTEYWPLVFTLMHKS
jgi:hypothetical protein